MPRWLPRFLWITLTLGLAGFAYGPLHGAGPVGEDFQVLDDVSRITQPAGDEERSVLSQLLDVHGQDERPLAALSLVLTGSLWTESGEWTPSAVFALRLENLALLLLAAIGMSRFLRRMLEPWAGREQARAASHAARVLIALHPLAAGAVASASARGDLLGAALAGFAANMFLRGRQERSKKLVLQAGLLTVAAGCASEIAFFVGPIVALGEFTSSRRHLRMKRRLRTATTSGVGFLLCALIEPAFAALGPGARQPDMASALGFFDGSGGLMLGLGLMLERLGMLVVPVNQSAFGPEGLALAGILGLVVLQPALIAARSAPRMWGWVLFWWIILVVLAQLPAAAVRVHPGDLTHAPLLLPAAVVAALGVALAATSNSGRRRFVLPALAASVFALLAQGDARAIAAASARAGEIKETLSAARVELGDPALLLSVDPLGYEGGRPITLLQGHQVLPEDLAALMGEDPSRVRRLSYEAFFALLADKSWETQRAQGVIVHGLSEEVAWIPPAAESTGSRLWREEGRSGALDLETASTRSVRVLARSETSTAEPPKIHWLSKLGEGELEGAWIQDEEGLHAVFDVGNVPAWVTGDRVRQVWFEKGLAVVVQAAAYGEARELTGVGEPVVDEGDWILELEPARANAAGGGEETYWLCLFDRTAMRYEELYCARDEDGRLRAAGAVALVERLALAGEAPEWSLEQRVGVVTVARSRRD
ncbi:MAG: hypothetical protein MK297_03555 [Planctomycetes bacterium]|nr:hypothetical protein [Planctomycetota bacterium]